VFQETIAESSMRYRDQRYPADKDVWLEHDGSRERVHLADMSISGARLLSLEPLQKAR
jgi:hypothetical protein